MTHQTEPHTEQTDDGRSGLVEILLERYDLATPDQQRAIVGQVVESSAIWQFENALSNVLDRSEQR